MAQVVERGPSKCKTLSSCPKLGGKKLSQRTMGGEYDQNILDACMKCHNGTHYFV
jgi:hypothetical protein